MLAGESIFFLPFVLVRIFRPTVLEVYNITNLELGQCFSIYGLTAMVSYFFGGPLADRFSNRKLIALGLISTAFGGALLLLFPTLNFMYFLYGLWGVSTILLFWSPLHKTIRVIGGESLQGISFGGVEAGRGFIAALLGTFGVLIFALTENVQESNYNFIVLLTSFFVAFIGVLAWFLIPENLIEIKTNSTIKWKQAVKNKKVWLMAIVILCAYVGYKITDDFSLYAFEILGFNEVDAAKVGGGALWLRFVFALFAGLLADKLKPSLIISFGFACIFIGGVLIALGVSNPAILVLFILAFILLGVYGIRGIYFALMQESAIPKEATGFSIGLMSFVGYTPDVFMSPIMGYLLDNNPGILGHQLVFAVMLIFAIIGFIAAFSLSASNKKNIRSKLLF